MTEENIQSSEMMSGVFDRQNTDVARKADLIYFITWISLFSLIMFYSIRWFDWFYGGLIGFFFAYLVTTLLAWYHKTVWFITFLVVMLIVIF